MSFFPFSSIEFYGDSTKPFWEGQILSFLSDGYIGRKAKCLYRNMFLQVIQRGREEEQRTFPSLDNPRRLMCLHGMGFSLLLYLSNKGSRMRAKAMGVFCGSMALYHLSFFLQALIKCLLSTSNYGLPA